MTAHRAPSLHDPAPHRVARTTRGKHSAGKRLWTSPAGAAIAAAFAPAAHATTNPGSWADAQLWPAEKRKRGRPRKVRHEEAAEVRVQMQAQARSRAQLPLPMQMGDKG